MRRNPTNSVFTATPHLLGHFISSMSTFTNRHRKKSATTNLDFSNCILSEKLFKASALQGATTCLPVTPCPPPLHAPSATRRQPSSRPKKPSSKAPSPTSGHNQSKTSTSQSPYPQASRVGICKSCLPKRSSRSASRGKMPS